MINYKQQYCSLVLFDMMTRFLVLLPFVGVSFLSALTLQEALDYSLEHAPDVAMIRADEVIQQYNLKGKMGAFLPSIDGNADLVHDNYLSQGVSTDPKTNLWRKDYSLVISQPVFDGMKRYYDYNQADRSLKATQAFVVDRMLSKISEIGSDYVKVLLSQQLVINAKENYKRLKEIVDLIDQRVSQGLSRELDRVQAKGRLATARAAMIMAMSELNKNQALFKAQSGGLDPVDLLPIDLQTLLPMRYEEYFEQALNYGVKIRQYAYLKEAAMAQYHASKSSFFPQLYALTRFEYRKNIDGNTDKQTNTQVGLNLSYNIFRGSQDLQNTNVLAERYHQACSELEKQKNELYYLILATWEDYQSAQQSYVFRKEHEQAVSNVVLGYKDQFLMGQRSLLDLLDAYNEWYYSLNNLAQDRAQLTIAELQILTLNGSASSLVSSSVARTFERDLVF